MRLTWLADVLRAEGLDVYEDPGWQTRGREFTTDLEGIVWHHTATGPTWLDGHVLALLRQGRRDLAGPLSQTGLERDGTWVLVAAGRANHNGYGLWGNNSIGVEAYNDGIGERWPTAQLDSYHRGTAAICRHLGWTADRVKGHRETDPTRKIDPTGIDMHAARVLVAALITKGPSMSDALTRNSQIYLWGKTHGLSAQEIRAVLDGGIDAAPRGMPTLGTIAADLAKIRSDLAAFAKAKPGIDEAKLAEEIARRLPGTSGPVKVADLEEALRRVLGSLDD